MACMLCHHELTESPKWAFNTLRNEGSWLNCRWCLSDCCVCGTKEHLPRHANQTTHVEVAACYPPDDKQERSTDKSRQILRCTIQAGLIGPSFEEDAALGASSARHVDVSSSAKIAGGLEASEALHTTTSGLEVTMTMTTLMEDVSNMCWASGTASKSDGVMTLENTADIWIGVERCWPKQVSGCSVRRQHTKNSAWSPTQEETECDKLNSAVANYQTNVQLKHVRQ